VTVSPPLARLDDVAVHFRVPLAGGLRRKRALLRAVDGVSLQIGRGQVVGLVGESGSGKSTTGRALLRLVDVAAGRVWVDGEDITRLRGRRLQPWRRRMQVVFQDPEASLDPRLRVGASVAEPLRIYTTMSAAERDRRVCELLQTVGLDPSLRSRWPHEFSGGQRQRVGVARALALDPELVVLDEPISALDVSVQAQVLNLLAELRKERGLSYLFIAHDLAAVAWLSDIVAVMYLGRVVEVGPVERVLAAGAHPYTRALRSSEPPADPQTARARGWQVLDGEIPSPLRPPPGCAFHPRCPLADARCRTEAPALRPWGGGAGHRVACHHPGEEAAG
jgi:oligopeptide/dipeptide ABC transporter ATP-binding protein